jgi:glucosylceramidase
MQDAGVHISAVTVQNEPGQDPKNYEGCLYTANEHRDFVKNHLGPILKGAFPTISIWGYDYNKDGAADYVQVNYADPAASAYLDGTAVHWYDIGGSLGMTDLLSIHAMDPSKIIIATEACWIPGLLETWQTAELYALDIAADINAWATGWVEWNIVLHYNTKGATGKGVKPGGPNHTGSAFGSAILLLQNDDGEEELIYQAPYWAIGHFSRFIRPGAKRVSTAGSSGIAVVPADYEAVRKHVYSPGTSGAVPLVATATVSADGSTASVVLINAGESAVEFELRDTGLGAVAVTIPAHAIQTLTYPTA